MKKGETKRTENKRQVEPKAEKKKNYESAGRVLVPIKLIDQPALSMRRNVENENLDELMQSIERVGLIQAVSLRRTGERFELVAGHRRLEAMRRLGMKAIPAEVRYLSRADGEVVKMHENMMRENVSAIDEAEYLAAVMEREKLSRKELAHMMGRSLAWLSDRLAVLEYEPDLREALLNDEIPFSAARELNRIKDDDVRAVYIKSARTNGINASTAAQWAKDANNYLPGEPETGIDEATGEPVARPAMPTYHCAICGEAHEVTELHMVRVGPTCLDWMQRVATSEQNRRKAEQGALQLITRDVPTAESTEPESGMNGAEAGG